MQSEEGTLLIRYQHLDCEVDAGVEWFELWDSACSSPCPACHTSEIEPIDWTPARACFSAEVPVAIGDA